MKGFFNSLTPKRQEAALAYEGPENHGAATAPAAMPSEEEIAKLLMKSFYDQWFAPGKPAWGGSVYWDFVNGSSAWSQQAQRILALFAPALAEKERRIAEWKAEVRREGDRFKDEVRDLNAECDRLHASALAAEAALAAERERCIAIVDAQVPDWVKERSGPYWEGYREAMEDASEDMRKGSAPRAAAIRAGE